MTHEQQTPGQERHGSHRAYLKLLFMLAVSIMYTVIHAATPCSARDHSRECLLMGHCIGSGLPS